MATSVANPTAGNDFVSKLSSPASATSASTGDMSDRFLKLLVTQMQNQDPLNPLDNAQVTTQMAQINTVSGIEKLNQGISSMSQMLSEKLGGLAIGSSLDSLNGTLQTLQGQMLQSQAVQGAALVGRTVLLEGSALQMAQGQGIGAFDLAGAADRVKVEVLGPAGQVIDTLDLGAQSAGRGGFSWSPPDKMDTRGLTFRVSAQSESANVPVKPLMADTVNAVSMSGNGLVLQLARGGSTAFNLVKALS
jgi:flagellar basal-body rod modification protein FlgD